MRTELFMGFFFFFFFFFFLVVFLFFFFFVLRNTSRPRVKFIDS